MLVNAASAVAKAENGGIFPIEGFLADDPTNDLVLLKIKGKDLPFLTLGTSNRIEVGTRIAVIGSPLGLEGTLSEGIVSAVREIMSDITKLQITAAISHGSSGSPVMNAKGDVVGVASALMQEGQALNFAVPVECVMALMSKIKGTTNLQALGSVARSGDELIYSDPDWRAACAAGSNGNYIAVLNHAKQLVARYPEGARAWFALACAFDSLNFTDDAIAAYRQTIKIKPDSVAAWRNLGGALSKAGQTDSAIAACRQAIKIAPDGCLAWHSLGMVYQEAGRFDDAAQAFVQEETLKAMQRK